MAPQLCGVPGAVRELNDLDVKEYKTSRNEGGSQLRALLFVHQLHDKIQGKRNHRHSKPSLPNHQTPTC